MLLTAIAACMVGCQRAVEPQFVSAAALSQLDPEMQTAVQQELRKCCGTPSDPKLLGGIPTKNNCSSAAPRCISGIASNVTASPATETDWLRST